MGSIPAYLEGLVPFGKYSKCIALKISEALENLGMRLRFLR